MHLDESDSGLDIDALKIVSDGVNSCATASALYYRHPLSAHSRLYQAGLRPRAVRGRIVKSGDFTLVKQLEEQGYGWLTEQQ